MFIFVCNMNIFLFISSKMYISIHITATLNHIYIYLNIFNTDARYGWSFSIINIGYKTSMGTDTVSPHFNTIEIPYHIIYCVVTIMESYWLHSIQLYINSKSFDGDIIIYTSKYMYAESNVIYTYLYRKMQNTWSCKTT